MNYVSLMTNVRSDGIDLFEGRPKLAEEDVTLDRSSFESLKLAADSEAAAGVETVMLLQQASRVLVTRVSRALERFELNFAQYELLTRLLFASPSGLSIAALGSLLQVHPSSAGVVARGLEKQGLAKRRQSDTDRRSFIVNLTATGESTVRKATEALNCQVFASLGISHRESDRLWRVLAAFRRAHGDY